MQGISVTQGCGGAASSEYTVPNESSPSESRGAHGEAFSVQAPYVATLLRAVESISQVTNAAAPEQYKTWFPDWAKEPPSWASVYRQSQSRWQVPAYYRDLKMGAVQRVCSYENVTVEQLIHCLQSMIPAEFHGIVAQAVREVDIRLAPHWGDGSSASGYRRSFERLLTTDPSRKLIRELRRFMQLGDDALSFKVVLAMAPPMDANMEVASYQHGDYFLLGVNPNRPPAWHMQVLMHELAHIATEKSPAGDDVENGLTGYGAAGTVAGSYWKETVATAFGQGLAASLFIPDQDARRLRWYSNPMVDDLAHQLYKKWTFGSSLRLGRKFAKTMIHLIQQVRPAQQYHLQDFLYRFQLWVWQPSVEQIVRQELDFRRYWPATYSTQDGAKLPYPTVPRLVFATPQQLTQSDVARLTDFPAQEMWQQLERKDAVFWYRPGLFDSPVFVIVAKDAFTLEKAALDFCHSVRSRIPNRGWNAL